MNFVTTRVFKDILKARHERHIWLEGGTASSKTFSIMQFLILKAIYSKSPLLISVVSETVPHLKRGCLRDFRNILGNSYQEDKFNRTDLIYDFGKVQMEFFSADNSSKLRGARRQILFLNEGNNVSIDAFRELDTRTELLTITDWNPVSEFWYHDQYQGDGVYIHSTFKDALHVVHPRVIENIKSTGKKDPNWWNVYGLGKLGKIEGLVYPHFDQVDSLPQGDYFYGLDFGYSNDPTVLTRNVIIADGLYSQELIYETGLTNDMIAHRMDELGVKRNYDEIFADAAEPKSIDEIKKYGFNIKACPKGADSVEYGHQKVRQYKQFWTKDSINCIKEQRNFRYIPDKNGKLTDKTTHVWSHGMDSRRYGVIGKINSHSEIYIG